MNIWFCAHGNREKWVTVENELKLWSIDTFLLRYFSWLIIQTTQVVRLLYDWRDIAISCWQVTFPWLKSFSVFFFFPVCVKTYPFEMVWIWNFLPTESFTDLVLWREALIHLCFFCVKTSCLKSWHDKFSLCGIRAWTERKHWKLNLLSAFFRFQLLRIARQYIKLHC